MVTRLPVKRGVSAPAISHIPEQWSREWFRSFITQFLVDIDLRNAVTSGISISGNVSGDNSSNPGNPVIAGLSPIPNDTVLGNVSGGTAAPVPLTSAQLAGITSTILTPGIGMYSINGQIAVLQVGTGGGGSYSMTAGSNAGPPMAVYGYTSGGLGSLSPTTLYGYTIQILESLIDTTVNNEYTDTFQVSAATNPGQSLFTSITVGAKTRTSAAASYLYNSGSSYAQWIWTAGGSSNGLFTATGATSVTIT